MSAAEDRLAELERANAALRAANASLLRATFTRADAGGASRIAAQRELETELVALRAELAARDARELELEDIARLNDQLYRQQRAWNAAKRYRIADRVAETVNGASSVLRRLRRGRG